MSYTLIGEHKKDARANRDGYIAAMTELMENDPTIVHIDCDLGGCINVGKLQAKSIQCRNRRAECRWCCFRYGSSRHEILRTFLWMFRSTPLL